jgi:hypothetical protein
MGQTQTTSSKAESYTWGIEIECGLDLAPISSVPERATQRQNDSRTSQVTNHSASPAYIMRYCLDTRHSHQLTHGCAFNTDASWAPRAFAC